VGDGIILEARYHQFNGNYVKVKHNGNYITGYLHMLKIASVIRPGTKVKQGQVIGYVGKTGLANGNHVCFRFWKNGVQIDAMKVQLPLSEPIKKEKLIDFNAHRDILLAALDTISYMEAELLLARKEQ
jgi:murein DD-endopeptidase MepM/ murein hydrolase activator NlpD